MITFKHTKTNEINKKDYLLKRFIFFVFFEIYKNKSKNLGYYKQKDYLYYPIKKSGTSAHQL
jgi:hypothetical protein